MDNELQQLNEHNKALCAQNPILKNAQTSKDMIYNSPLSKANDRW